MSSHATHPCVVRRNVYFVNHPRRTYVPKFVPVRVPDLCRIVPLGLRTVRGSQSTISWVVRPWRSIRYWRRLVVPRFVRRHVWTEFVCSGVVSGEFQLSVISLEIQGSDQGISSDPTNILESMSYSAWYGTLYMTDHPSCALSCNNIAKLWMGHPESTRLDLWLNL